jgi:hypothetical protein
MAFFNILRVSPRRTYAHGRRLWNAVCFLYISGSFSGLQRRQWQMIERWMVRLQAAGAIGDSAAEAVVLRVS